MEPSIEEIMPVPELKGMDPHSFVGIEEELLKRTFGNKKTQIFINSLSLYEKRWVENHLQEEMKLHSLLLSWRYGDRSYSEMSENHRLLFQNEMLGFLNELLTEQRRKRG